MKSILKNSNGNAVSTGGKLITVSANYTDQIKQALIDKGVATEDTHNSELPNIINESIKEDMLQKRIDILNKCEYIFYHANQEIVDYCLPRLDLSKLPSLQRMFYYSGATKIPLFDISNYSEIGGLFSYVNNNSNEYELDVSHLDFSNVEKIQSTFSGNSGVTKIILPSNMRKVKSLDSCFYGCSKLVEIEGEILCNENTSSFYNVFSGCSNLEIVKPIINCRSMPSISYFSDCKKLTTITLINIKGNVSIGKGDGTNSSDYGHLLTLNSLINIIKELVNVGTTKKLTIGTANLEKIANVYVRRTTEGDIPTCASDNSNIELAKAPCEVCESTDEGAMLITAYANSKNWTLA